MENGKTVYVENVTLTDEDLDSCVAVVFLLEKPGGDGMQIVRTGTEPMSEEVAQDYAARLRKLCDVASQMAIRIPKGSVT